MNDLFVVGVEDLPEVTALLERSPAENLLLLARVAEARSDWRRLGRLLAYRGSTGEITSVCLDSGLVFVTGYDSASLPHFVTELGGFRRATSLVGPSFSALGLHLGLVTRWGDMWGVYSNIRRTQPVMVLDQPLVIDPDPRVTRLEKDVFDSYLVASVDMYTSEIGSSPYKYGPGYDSYALSRLEEGDAWGIVENGEVIFKADLGPRYDQWVQLQGVWVKPELRGQGIAVPALAAMLHEVQQKYPKISLYVNDFNTPAIRSYQRLGFRSIGALSTIHY